ncbi:outer membrane lipid asymmetry maintenance protein MlaD [Marinobacterium sp. LSUCC0821]|jgi:phospholipid/cholesterol/gamma-HCH transport system substrate-binding protein|uniref:outer membrane lipid asymmetry maintenance protein MlaD n=1 Tax=Marinobacterium sp. LSUCC0821 TaxID=2668067 RepID=UPI001451985F|nr:outer membrane lipid asymmetry maintenance protein MlaD [Marinobacterium sp. LSUCC0821]QJD70404.1 outer membrane lipid asymmetry maintenance protein MlaD [Marinobacterium sp. LSUCC0821]
MRIRTLEISVGALILAGLLALVVLAINVSGLNVADQGQGYKVVARFDNIGGLTERAKVSLSGVQIGQVSAIRIDKKRLMAEVEMTIFSDVNYLSSDSSAQILTAGLLGEKYIGITPGFEEELLKDGSTIEDTQSALVLEEIVGKFLFNKVSE